ncbi:MAG: MarR family transcriptional regulator [Nakamurella sp.]
MGTSDTAVAGPDEVSAAELTECLMRVAHQIRRTSMASMTKLDLTPAQSRALRTISKSPDPIRMGVLASTLGVVPRSATGLVDALEKAGLVERAADPGNRRSVLVTLTGAGRARQQAMLDARVEAGDGLFSALDQAERRVLAGLLKRLSPAPGDEQLLTVTVPDDDIATLAADDVGALIGQG